MSQALSRFSFAGLGGDRRGGLLPSGSRAFRRPCRQRGRWRARERLQGDARPKALGGDRRSARIEAHADLTFEWVELERDITLGELRACLAEQDRPDILKWRQAWFDGQIDLDLNRLVFSNGTWAWANMVRRVSVSVIGRAFGSSDRGGATWGYRCWDGGAPHRHGSAPADRRHRDRW